MRHGQLLNCFVQLPVCTVVMECCGGAHRLAREGGALGHEVRLIAPPYAKPFGKGNINDFIDTEATRGTAACSYRVRKSVWQRQTCRGEPLI
ncbi:hypothetical protein D3C75_799310 [compost metagenome]